MKKFKAFAVWFVLMVAVTLVPAVDAASNTSGTDDASSEEVGIGLATLIGEVRSELDGARNQGEDQEIRFSTDWLELELQFSVVRGKNGGFKLQVPFLPIGGDATRKSQVGSTQRITIRMQVRDRDGNPVPVADR